VITGDFVVLSVRPSLNFMNILKQVCLKMFVPEDVCAWTCFCRLGWKAWIQKRRGDNVKKMAPESTEGWVHPFTSIPISTEML